MECDPAVSVVALYVALPPLIVLVPKVVAPSANVTVPVPVEGVTVAVSVSAELYVDGFSEETIAVVVFALLIVCESAEEVLLR
jgi:hypothetical protein